MNIYELYGRKEEQLQNSISEHLKTLTALKSIKDEKLKIEDIDVWDDGWKINEGK